MKKKIKTEIEGISASFCLFPLGIAYVCKKRWLSSDVHERKMFQIYQTVQNNQGNDSENAFWCFERIFLLFFEEYVNSPWEAVMEDGQRAY